MSNTYNDRRRQGRCGRCGVDAKGRPYCDDCRRYYRDARRAERESDRDGYNAYMRAYKACGKG